MEYQHLFSTAARELRPSGIRRYFDLPAGSEDVINLGVGQPDQPLPAEARNAFRAALSQENLPYTANAGLLSLRESIAGYLERRFGLTYAADGGLLATVGGSEAIDLALRALVDPGDEVIVPQPSFVCYGPLTRLCGGREVPVTLTGADGYRLTAAQVRAALTPRTKLLVLPYPSNPTGAVMTKESLEALAEALAGTEVLVLSDEVYAELTYDAPHVSPASVPGLRDRTVVVGSASKCLAMTGARIGFAAGPGPIIAAMTRIHQYGIMSAPTAAQQAAAAAFADCDAEIDRMRRVYDRRRCLMLGGLACMGLPCHEPEGAFYLFPDITASGLDSQTFCSRLLAEARVAAIPGIAFGDAGEGHIRLCYAADEARLKEALRRLADFWRGVSSCAA